MQEHGQKTFEAALKAIGYATLGIGVALVLWNIATGSEVFRFEQLHGALMLIFAGLYFLKSDEARKLKKQLEKQKSD